MIFRKIEGQQIADAVKIRTNDLRELCVNLGMLRYALIVNKGVGEPFIEDSSDDKFLTRLLTILGKLESHLHSGNEDKLDEILTEIKYEIKNGVHIFGKRGLHHSSSVIKEYNILRDKLISSMKEYFDTKYEDTLKELTSLCRDVSKAKKDEISVKDWKATSTLLSPVLEVLYEPFGKKIPDALELHDRALLQKMIVDAPAIIRVC